MWGEHTKGVLIPEFQDLDVETTVPTFSPHPSVPSASTVFDFFWAPDPSLWKQQCCGLEPSLAGLQPWAQSWLHQSLAAL